MRNSFLDNSSSWSSYRPCLPSLGFFSSVSQLCTSPSSQALIKTSPVDMNGTPALPISSYSSSCRKWKASAVDGTRKSRNQRLSENGSHKSGHRWFTRWKKITTIVKTGSFLDAQNRESCWTKGTRATKDCSFQLLNHQTLPLLASFAESWTLQIPTFPCPRRSLTRTALW